MGSRDCHPEQFEEGLDKNKIGEGGLRKIWKANIYMVLSVQCRGATDGPRQQVGFCQVCCSFCCSLNTGFKFNAIYLKAQLASRGKPEAPDRGGSGACCWSDSTERLGRPEEKIVPSNIPCHIAQDMSSDDHSCFGHFYLSLFLQLVFQRITKKYL